MDYGLDRITKIKQVDVPTSMFKPLPFENYVDLWNCKLKYFAELWLSVQLRYSMAIGIVFWMSQAIINLKPITWPWTFTKITIKKIKKNIQNSWIQLERTKNKEVRTAGQQKELFE